MAATRGLAVVTGGAGGLGTAFCAALAAAGYEAVPVDVAGTERALDVTDAAACAARWPRSCALRCGSTTRG